MLSLGMPNAVERGAKRAQAANNNPFWIRRTEQRGASGRAPSLRAAARRDGIPLSEWCEGRFHYGIKTGLNEAFVIEGAQRADLIAADPKSAEIIKPFLRGRDLKRWQVEPADKWLIFTRQGTDISRYPAIKPHLEKFWSQLEPRPRDWNERRDGGWGGRKAGPYKWYEIQDTVAYRESFEEPKIFVPAIEKQCDRIPFDEEAR